MVVVTIEMSSSSSSQSYRFVRLARMILCLLLLSLANISIDQKSQLHSKPRTLIVFDVVVVVVSILVSISGGRFFGLIVEVK